MTRGETATARTFLRLLQQDKTVLYLRLLMGFLDHNSFLKLIFIGI